MKGILGAALLTVLLSSCATQRFTINAPVGPANAPTLETSQAFFVEGLGQDVVLNAAEVCGGAQNVASVEVQETFLDGLLGGLTFGIYTPRTARVYCLS